MSSWYYPPYSWLDFFDDTLTDHLLTGSPGPPSQQVQRQGRGGDTSGFRKPFRPKMDLHEDTSKNLVTATFELPGLKKEDVHIDAHNNRLTVQGESKASEEYDQGGWAVRERHSGRFTRALQLPPGVTEDQIKASMDNGVLTVSFPKSSPEDSPKKITIN